MLRTIARVIELQLVNALLRDVASGGIVIQAEVIAVRFPVGHILLKDLPDQRGRLLVDVVLAVAVRFRQLAVNCLFERCDHILSRLDIVRQLCEQRSHLSHNK